MNIQPLAEAHIKAHAKRAYPKEACGLLVIDKGKHLYVPCRNEAENTEHFIMNVEDYAAAEDKYNVLSVVHSHPNLPPIASQADRTSCNITGLPWIIVGWPSAEIKTYLPDNFVAPLIGREFSHGVLDCYSLIRDYYKATLKIILPEHERRDNWWNMGENLYLDNYEKDGWILVDKSQRKKHDMVYMRVSSKVSNHAGIFLGDNKILHHVMGRISTREVYGGYWEKVTTHILRRKEFAC